MKSESISSIAKALCEFQSELPVISLDREVEVKTRTGGVYKFKYATLRHVIDTVKPLLVKHKLSYSQPLQSDGSVETIIMHESGEFISSVLLIKGEATPQGVGSAISYAKRYSLCSILGIIADDDDDGNIAQGNEFKTKTQKAATSYNHKELGIKEKPLITNGGFKKALERMIAGEKGVYDKVMEMYSLEPAQLQLINQEKNKLNGQHA